MVLLLPDALKLIAELRSHQCLSACSGVVTEKLAELIGFGTGHQCLSACSGVVTTDSGFNVVRRYLVTNAFRPVVVLLQR